MANGYVLGQLATAFTTAAEHEDVDARRRATERAGAWLRTVRAIASGQVVPGSRTPVVGLPGWVTLGVLRGGFATGSAVAEGPLEQDEIELAERVGIQRDRRLLFWYHLTEGGLTELYSVLDSQTYRVSVPEDAALLTVAWLLRRGDRAAALDLIDVLAPLADRLRLTPRRTAVAPGPPEHMFRTRASSRPGGRWSHDSPIRRWRRSARPSPCGTPSPTGS